MQAQPLRYPRTILAFWFAGLCLLALLVAGLNLAMRDYADSARVRDHRTWIAKANAALEAGNYSEARDEIIMARHLAPGHPAPLISEGHLHFRLKKWDFAVEAYQQAILFGSKDAGIRQNIIWACIELGDFRKAAQLGRQYMEEGYSGGQLPRYIAEAHLRMKNPSGAIAYLKLALDLEPGDLYLLDKLLRSYRATDQVEQADAIAGHIEELQSELSSNRPVSP